MGLCTAGLLDTGGGGGDWESALSSEGNDFNQSCLHNEALAQAGRGSLAGDDTAVPGGKVPRLHRHGP